MYSWKDDIDNSNFNFYYDLVFNVRSRIRRNNSQFYVVSKQKEAYVMFFNMTWHDIYRTILRNDMKARALAPDVVNEYMAQNESFSWSWNKFKGEGGDYVTENENKHLKSNLPPGVPSFTRWQMASRDHEVLQKNRESVVRKAAMNDPGNQKISVFNFEFEVQAVRKMICESILLWNPRDKDALKSLDGVNLHPALVNFYHTAVENYNKYSKDPDAELKPVFVTYEDEEIFSDVNNWTIAKIDKEIGTLIKVTNVGNEELMSEFAKIKGKKKSVHVSLLLKIRTLIDVSIDNDDFNIEKTPE